MKRLLSVLLVIGLTLSLAACSSKSASSQATTEATTVAAPAPAASSAEDTSEPEPAEPQTAFDDVSPKDPFFAAAEALADKGLLEGVVSGRTFGPDTEVTLEDLAQIVYNLAGQPKLTAEQQSAAGSTDALKWLSATIGYGDYDDASSVVTRSEFATIVYLLAAKFDGELPAKLEAVEFEDVAELTMLEQTAISAVYEAGLVEAEAPEFLPEEAVERKDIAEPIDELAELYPPGTELAEAFPEEVEEIIHYEELEAARIAEEQRLAAEQAAAAEQARLAEEQRQREEAQRQQEQQVQQPAPAPATPEPAPAPQPEPTPAPAPQPEPVQPASGGFLSADIAPEITSYATSIGVSWVGGCYYIQAIRGYQFPIGDPEATRRVTLNLYDGHDFWTCSAFNGPAMVAELHAYSIEEIKNFIRTYLS